MVDLSSHNDALVIAANGKEQNDYSILEDINIIRTISHTKIPISSIA